MAVRLSGANRCVKLSIIWVIDESALIRFGALFFRGVVGPAPKRASDNAQKQASIIFFMGCIFDVRSQKNTVKKYAKKEVRSELSVLLEMICNTISTVHLSELRSFVNLVVQSIN